MMVSQLNVFCNLQIFTFWLDGIDTTQLDKGTADVSNRFFIATVIMVYHTDILRFIAM